MSTIKRIPEDDFGALVDVARNAYPSMKVITPEDREKAKNRFLKMQEEFGNADFYGLYRDNNILGSMLLHDFKMQFASMKIDAGGVGFVAVDLLHKKEKIAKEMITYYLDHYKEKGAYMAVLYPFRPDFYKNMGFGFGTKMNQYRIKPCHLPKGNSKKDIHVLGEDDKVQLLECYKRYMSRTHGMIEKAPHEADGIFRNSENKVMGYRKNDRVEGYLIFSFKQDEKVNFLTNDIYIKELIYENQEALYQLMTFLNSQNDQIRHIIINSQEENLHFIMSDPRNDSNNVIPHVYHESNTQGVGIMYRVIDVKGIFKVLEDHNFNNENLKLKLIIKDSFLNKDQERTVIHFTDGKGKVKTTDDYDVEVTMDVSDFSSLLMGVTTFKTLYRYGLAHLSDVKFIDKINKAFMQEEKPMCITPF